MSSATSTPSPSCECGVPSPCATPSGRRRVRRLCTEDARGVCRLDARRLPLAALTVVPVRVFSPGRSRKKIRDAKKTQEREVAERITNWRDKKGKQTVSRAEVSRLNRKVRPALTAQGAVAYKEEFTQQKQ